MYFLTNTSLAREGIFRTNTTTVDTMMCSTLLPCLPLQEPIDRPLCPFAWRVKRYFTLKSLHVLPQRLKPLHRGGHTKGRSLTLLFAFLAVSRLATGREVVVVVVV